MKTTDDLTHGHCKVFRLPSRQRAPRAMSRTGSIHDNIQNRRKGVESFLKILREDKQNSCFNLILYENHLKEAMQWVNECEKSGKRCLDSCGERGDLFFMIQSHREVLQI